MNVKRTCGNCHHFKPSGGVIGDCSAPIPASVSALFNRFKRNPMLDDSGSKCPAHRMRTTRKAAKVEQGVQQ